MDKPLHQCSLEEVKLIAQQEGVPFEEDVTRPALIAAVNQHLKSKAEEGEGAGEGAPQKGGGKAEEKQAIYYLVKVKSYVSEKELWEPGLYKVTAPVARFEGQSEEYIRKFVGSVPDMLVYDLARDRLMPVEYKGGNAIPARDLLEKIAIRR